MRRVSCARSLGAATSERTSAIIRNVERVEPAENFTKSRRRIVMRVLIPNGEPHARAPEGQMLGTERDAALLPVEGQALEPPYLPADADLVGHESHGADPRVERRQRARHF